jgi:hypothetical protein
MICLSYNMPSVDDAPITAVADPLRALATLT